jgi:hypothetical protein
MLTAYLDESGQETDQHVVVGGFLGDDEQWCELSKQWREGLAPRKNLHMRELRWNGNKAYRTRLLMEKLTPIPAKCGLLPIAISLNVSDYSDLIEDTLLTKRITAGYIFAAEIAVVGALIWAWAKKDTVKVVFEQQDEHGPLAGALWRTAWKGEQTDTTGWCSGSLERGICTEDIHDFDSAVGLLGIRNAA